MVRNHLIQVQRVIEVPISVALCQGAIMYGLCWCFDSVAFYNILIILLVYEVKPKTKQQIVTNLTHQKILFHCIAVLVTVTKPVTKVRDIGIHLDVELTFAASQPQWKHRCFFLPAVDTVPERLYHC